MGDSKPALIAELRPTRTAAIVDSVEGENEDEHAAGLSPSGRMLKEEPIHSLTPALADLDSDGWIHAEERGRFNWGLRVEDTSVKNLAEDLTRLCYPVSVEFEAIYAHRAGGRQLI